VNRTRASAFSLIELIVVLLIMGSVGSVIVACFMGGVRAYERARDFGRGETDAYLAFEVLERDLKNSVGVPGLPFKGAPSRMQFATVQVVPVAEFGDSVDVAVVRYWKNPGDGVVRSVTTLGDPVSDVSGGGELLLSGDVTMRLAFRSASEDGAVTPWTSAWQSTSNLPQQVRIQLSGGALGASALERTVLVPGQQE
jgi:type II secretory pathway pseudopilin PulG